MSMGVEIWTSIAKGGQWWLLLRRNVMVMEVVAISEEQSSITHCRSPPFAHCMG